MRRVIIHAGFHKTGTNSLQQTLRDDLHLLLRPAMLALCEYARAYSRSREKYDLGQDAKRRAALVPVQARDKVLADALKAGLLALNRSDLDTAALKAAKRAVIAEAG